MKVKIDKDLCIGCGVCASVCPEMFEMDDDNLAEAKQEDVPENLESDVKDAADSCPVEAIIIEQ